MNWKITETNQLTPPDVDRQGNKFLIGNGYVGCRGALEEFDKTQKTAVIVSGLYDRVGEQWREPVNLPNGCYVQVFYQGQPLHALSSNVLAHSQGLDLYSAVHERQTVFEAGGAQISVQARRFASLARRQLICLEYTVRAERTCELEIQSGVDGDVWDINGPHLTQLSASEAEGILSVSAASHENAVPLAVSEAVSLPDAFYSHSLSETGLGGVITGKLRRIRLNCGPDGIRLFKFVAHVTGLDEPDPLAASRALCREAKALGFDALLAEHSALWAERWQDCDIQIVGDEAAQQALRFSMYHLLSIVPAHSERSSIPARGMSGQMYKGAIFWDTEIFMLPFFTCAFPALARNLLLYRYHTLDGARRKARDYGYRGAFYAWESQDNGDDACTLFNVTDVFTNRPMRTYFRDRQVHISADIAYAFWQYFLSTGDGSIWRAGGAEVVFECARFFLSYAYYNPDRRRYEILDVTGPDEYHERVHNNAFTNRMVAHTFEVCLQVAEYLQEQAPEFLGKLLSDLNFACDLALIAEMAAGLYQPDSGAAGAIIPQFDGYFNLEDVSLPALLQRKLHPHEYLGGGNGLATTTQIVKQADVVLTLFLFGERYSPAIKSANWEFYEPRTEHGSSLSACSYALIAAEIGKVDWAYKYFMKTATIDLTGEGKQYVGPLYIGGTHPAGNGGAWMSAVFGLCGIRCAGENLSIQPHLPAHWQEVQLPVQIHGQKLQIQISRQAICIRPARPLRAPLQILVNGAVYPLQSAEIYIPFLETQVAV